MVMVAGVSILRDDFNGGGRVHAGICDDGISSSPRMSSCDGGGVGMASSSAESLAAWEEGLKVNSALPLS